MIRRLIHTALVALILAIVASSCQPNEWAEDSPKNVPEGYVSIRFDAEIPSMPKIVTRAVDPDGGGVQNMTLFCFDAYGLFISTASTTTFKPNEDTPSLSGTFNATIPQNTRRIHFLANQNMNTFEEDDFRSKSEAEVMAVLEGSAGMMIYWARFVANSDNIQTDLEALTTPIMLVRNQAKVTVNTIGQDGSEHFVMAGFEVCNTNAFGTVAPYSQEAGGFVWPGEKEYVTLPQNLAKLSDIQDVQYKQEGQDLEIYVFECENKSDDPVSVIIKGHNSGETEDLYYRVMLIDESGNQVLIRRNFHYQLRIDGPLSYGQKEFKDALQAAATNNVWLSIADEVKTVENDEYKLTVSHTSVILPASPNRQSYTSLRPNDILSYTLERTDGSAISDDELSTLSVSWMDGNNVASNLQTTFIRESSTDAKKTYSINFDVEPLNSNNQKQEGTLVIKKGLLQRKIKVITIPTQSFTPAWASTQVYGGDVSDDKAGSSNQMTLMFTIPETCPAELFPLKVLLSVNDLDIRSAAGVDLPVIFEGDADYGTYQPTWQYKYVYTVNEPGTQRVYFRNILAHGASDPNKPESIVIEANFFETLTRYYTYSNDQKEITVTGLSEYSRNNNEDNNGLDGDFAADQDIIYYRLVPQKKGAYVTFRMELKENGSNIPAGANDEFLLYSQNLDYIKDGDEPSGITAFDCTFYEVDPNNWGAGGRVHMFKPRAKDQSSFSIYLRTNRPKSEEVIRIASNQTGSASGDPDKNGAAYAGGTYRSAIFELANNNPFRFAARLTNNGTVYGDGEDTTGEDEEVVTPVTLSYVPEQAVDITFDVTSFRGTDGNSADPFGEEFEIYIDAPMLEINTASPNYNRIANKLKEDPTTSGRFIYTVDKNRETERQYGIGTVVNTEQDVNQIGERKLLPFKTLQNMAVTAGDITISSDENQVIFFKKTFSISNSSIEGSIKYGHSEEDATELDKDSFVTFERASNGSRVGSMTVSDKGKYKLRLRKEYSFSWYDDTMLMRYTDSDGTVYSCSVSSLQTLFANPDVILLNQ